MARRVSPPAQALEVIDLVKKTTKNGRKPFLLVGDFNARPDQFEVQWQHAGVHACRV